jgi:hypothetical protein
VWGAITGAFSAFGPGAKATIIIVLVLALLLLPVTVLLLLLLLIAVVIVAIVRAVRRLLNPDGRSLTPRSRWVGSGYTCTVLPGSVVRANSLACSNPQSQSPVGFQNSAVGVDLRF